MKVFRIISHPMILITAFSLLLISGEHFGGFYLFYVALALPHGALHAVLATIGILLVLTTFLFYQERPGDRLKSILNIAGLMFMTVSLFYFFSVTSRGYNDQTFEQVVPIISLIMATFFGVCFLVDNLLMLVRKSSF